MTRDETVKGFGSGRYLIEILSRNISAGNEKNYEKLSGQPVGQQRFEPDYIGIYTYT